MFNRKIISFFLIISFIALGSVVLQNCKPKEIGMAILSDSTAFVGSLTCQPCHFKEFNDWKISDHFKSMQVASDLSILGNFNNSTFTADGVVSRFYKKEGKFYINTQGEDGANHDFEVKYAFGFRPLQQYLIEFAGGRLQSTRLSWDTKANKWFHQYPNQKIPPHDWLHWTGNSQNWNTMCASCHSTNLQKNYDFEKDQYGTTFHEINVGCESCHGAGKSHIGYINGDYKNGNKIAGSLIKIGKGTDQVALINNCAPCHVRASSISASSFNATLHTGELMDHFIPEIPSNEHFYADGQANDEDYTYTSFEESKMFRCGVKCSSCHNPHTGKMILPGNNVCLQCHSKTFDNPLHTFHQVGSEGAECKNCHMPGKTYMGNDYRYDHTFRVPRPDLTVQYGTPNACNNCHKDKPSKWAADAVVKWYGETKKYHFAEDLIPGSMPNAAAEPHLLRILEDTSAPAVIRATAVNYLKRHVTSNSLKALLKNLNDTDTQVRYTALQSLSEFPENEWVNNAGFLLSDKVRAVRIAAAELYDNLSAERIPAEFYVSYRNAKTELENYLLFQSDFAIGSVMIGDYFLRQKNHINAEKYYLRALQKDTSLNYVRLNLSTAYNALGKNRDALAILLEARQIEPKNERVYYNLALLYVELNNRVEAEKCFEKAVKLKSTNPRLYYNYGLLLEQNNNNKAELIFKKGLDLNPQDLDINYALALFYFNSKQLSKAIGPATVLKNNNPSNPDYLQIFRTLGL